MNIGKVNDIGQNEVTNLIRYPIATFNRYLS
jgi:hypothetical protein